MSNNCIKPNSVLGPASKHIKFGTDGLLAVEGPLAKEKLLLSQLRIPYAQTLKGRIILKANQEEYVLNHLGLGDNVTFLAITALYDPKSRNEADNIINYFYSDDPTTERSFAQVMILTGNSISRIPQLLLTNPNTEHDVVLEVLVAIIDDATSFFDSTGQGSVVTFENLLCTDIITWVVGETIAILNSDGDPIAFIQLENINSFSRDGTTILIDDEAVGQISLDFIDEFNAIQALSVLSWITENPNGNIQDDLNGEKDSVAPVVCFTSEVSIVTPETWYSIASGIWASASSWSETQGGTAGDSHPRFGDTVFIDSGHDLVIEEPANILALNFVANTIGSSVTVGATLSVFGDITFTDPIIGVDQELIVNANVAVEDIIIADELFNKVTLDGGIIVGTPTIPDCPVTSEDDTDFISTTLSLGSFAGTITEAQIRDHIVFEVTDDRDGVITINDLHTVIKDTAGNEFTSIITPTTYVITFEIDDIAENVVSPDVNVILEVTA